jgi:hypothetical protein
VVKDRVKKLTEAEVLFIRSSPKAWGSRVALAERYGVTVHNISAILAGKTWRHLLLEAPPTAPEFEADQQLEAAE